MSPHRAVTLGLAFYAIGFEQASKVIVYSSVMIGNRPDSVRSSRSRRGTTFLVAQAFTGSFGQLSRPVKDCEGCPALAGVRNVGLDDPRARRPDSHCDFGDRRIRACPVARSVKSRSTWTGPRSQRGVSARLRGFPIPPGPRSRPVRSRRLGRPATSRGRR